MFDALRVGSVPIYFGDSKALSSRVPADAVLVLGALRPGDDAWVAALAARLRALAGNHTAYYAYHAWRDRSSSARTLAHNLRGNRYTAFHRMCEFYHTNKEALDRRRDLYFDAAGWHTTGGDSSRFGAKQQARARFAEALAASKATHADTQLEGRDMGFLLLIGFVIVASLRFFSTWWWSDQSASNKHAAGFALKQRDGGGHSRMV